MGLGDAVVARAFHLRQLVPDNHSEDTVPEGPALLPGEEAQIEPVVVTARMRSSGVGAQLVDAARSEARRLGVRCLNVSPVARNVEAIAFFVREGFGNVGHINLFHHPGGEIRRTWRSGLTIHDHPLSY